MSSIRRSFKIKLYPTSQQRTDIEQAIGANRWLWNHFLALRKELYEQKQEHINYVQMANMLPIMKKDVLTSWLSNIPSQTLQQTLKRLEDAFKHFYRRVRNGEKPGYPRFKSKKQYLQSITYPKDFKFNTNGTKVYLPKIGWVKCRGYREFKNSNLQQLIVKIYSDGLIEASCSVICENQANIDKTTLSIGLDVGTRKFVTDSNGNMVKPLNLKNEWNKLKKYQRLLDTTKKGSKNQNKVYDKLRKIHRKISNKRNDWLHKLSLKYLHYRYVYIEDLNIKQMIKNTSGTLDNPNYTSKQKTKLNHQVTQQSWSKFFDILRYKLIDSGSILYKVDPYGSSQECSSCHRIDPYSRNGESYTCTSCGYKNDADINAANVILYRGEVKQLRAACI
jgi:putative transposase